MDNTNESFGEFITAPSIHQPNRKPSINQTFIDNNTLYKKLLDIEMEINNIKMLINTIKSPQPTFYSQPPQLQTIPTIWSDSNFSKFKTDKASGIWKSNQTEFN